MADNGIDVSSYVGVVSDKSAGGPGPANTPANIASGTAPDLTDIITQTALQNKNIAEAVTNIVFNTGKNAEAAGQEKSSILAAGKDTATALEEAGKLKLQEQQSKIDVANMLGVNIQVDPSTVRKLNETAQQHYQNAQDEISKEESRGPIGRFINNQLIEKGFLPDKIALETKAAQLAEARMGNLLTHAQQQLQITTSIAPTTTAASIKAQSQLALDQAAKQVAEVDQRTAAFNTEAIRTVANMNEQQLSNSTRAYELIQQDKQRALQQQSLDLAMAERKDRLAQKQETEQDAEFVLNAIKTGAGVYGKGIPDMPARRAVQLMTSPQYKQYYEAGIAKITTGTPAYGNTPAEAADNLLTVQAQVPNIKQNSYSLLMNARDAASRGIDVISGKEAGTATAPFDKKNKESVSMLTNANAIQLAQLDHSLIDPKNNANIYQAPKATDIIALAGLKDNEFIQKVVKPIVDSGMTNTDPDMLVDATVDAIQQNPSKFNSYTAGLATYFNTAITLNNSNIAYEGMGLPIQKDYNTRIRGTIFGHERVNLANQAEVNKIITKRLAAARGAGKAQKAGGLGLRGAP